MSIENIAKVLIAIVFISSIVYMLYTTFVKPSNKPPDIQPSQVWLKIGNYEVTCNICGEHQRFSFQDRSLKDFVGEHYARHFLGGEE